ncbi:MAG: GtrA family protein [Patescibacteria group bacterium]
MLQQLRRFYQKEFWGLFRYGVVGVVCLIIHTTLYVWMSRYIWISGSRTVQYTIALLVSAAFNFSLHRLWTFQVKSKSFAMVVRYSTVVGSSMLFQSVAFYFINVVLHMHDSVAFLVAVISSIVYQYFGHRFVTYNERYEKKAAVVPEPPVV